MDFANSGLGCTVCSPWVGIERYEARRYGSLERDGGAKEAGCVEES